MRMVASADIYQKEIEAAEKNANQDAEAEAAVAEAENAFTTNAGIDIETIDVTNRLADPADTLNTPALARHVDEAVIRLKGPDAIRIHCRRDGARLQVNEVIASKHGHASRITPNAATAARLDRYASTILQAWGLACRTRTGSNTAAHQRPSTRHGRPRPRPSGPEYPAEHTTPRCGTR